MIYPLTPVSIATFNLIRADASLRLSRRVSIAGMVGPESHP